MSDLLSPGSPPPVPPIDGFETSGRGLGVLEPVAAVGLDGTTHVIAIVESVAWPAFLLDDGTFVRFPGEGSTARKVAIAIGPKGRLHAAWTAGQSLFYAMLDVETRAGPVVQLVTERADEPNIAVSRSGRVAITYNDGWLSRTPDTELMLIEGSMAEGFAAPTRLNIDCCSSWTNETYDVHLGSLIYDDREALHVAFTWWIDADGVLDYVSNESGEWRLVHRITGVSTGARPGFALNDAGAHVTYAAPESNRLIYVNILDGEAQPPTTIFTADFIRESLMMRDVAGVLHLVVETWGAATNEIEYLRVTEAGTERIEVVSAAKDDAIVLSPRTGGLAVGLDGTLMIPYRRGGEVYGGSGTAELAVGRLQK